MTLLLTYIYIIGVIVIFISAFLTIKTERNRYYDFCDFKSVCLVNPKSWFGISKINQDFYFSSSCFDTTQRIKNGLGVFNKNEFLLNTDDFRTIGKGRIIAIKTFQIKEFCKLLMKNSLKTFPFILITADCDDSSSSYAEEIKQILNHHSLVKMYCINNDISLSHPKLETIPIGIDYHTDFFNQFRNVFDFVFGAASGDPRKTPKRQETELLGIKSILPHPFERPPLAYTSATLSMNDSAKYTKHNFKGLRKELKDRKKEFEGIITYQDKRISKVETWIRHGDFLFIVSPPGAGLDCFRTWEAIILGNIPILLKTPHFTETSLFDELPVVFIENYSEITLENMEIWKAEFIEKFESYKFEKLTLKYWEDKFVEDLDSFSII